MRDFIDELEQPQANSTVTAVKRGFDLLAGVCVGIVCLPIVIIVALAIYFLEGSPVFFSQDRVGFGSCLFRFYKFRTMSVDHKGVLERYLTENPEAKRQWDEKLKLENDPRVTKIGRFLRRTSLDELPQLVNVLKGDMSLVGPRPLLVEELPKYGKHITCYKQVKPGITGYWQVSGRNDVSFAGRAELDSWYVHNWSLKLDIVILLKTAKVVLSGKGAY